MWISTRRRFREGDDGWDSYISFIGLPHLREVRTIDSSLNEPVDDCENYPCELSSVTDVLQSLPVPSDDSQYYLGYIDVSSEPVPADSNEWVLLGYDLSDDTHTSSLLNCGPWGGELKPFTQRLNEYGLLSLQDAEKAKEILPREWKDDPHAQVTIWALYERRLDE